jgi:K+-sensing histidine kinase KdpD
MTSSKTPASDLPSTVAPVQARSRILVVDDHPINRRLLSAQIVSGGDYECLQAASGTEALEQLRGGPVDLVLLDIMMPGMDGYEVCRQIRSDPALRLIPIIALTALTETKDRIHGLDAGADDFVSKPVQIEELLARVRRHLHNGCRERALDKQRSELAACNTQLLQHQQSKDQLVRMLVHDLNNPLTGLLAVFELLQDSGEPLREESKARLIEAGSQTSNELERLVYQLACLPQLGQAKPPLRIQEVDLGRIAYEVQLQQSFAASKSGVSIAIQLENEPVTALADGNALRRVLANLVCNALRYAPRGSQVVVRTRREPQHVLFEVLDKGPGVPPESRQRVFDPFYRGDSSQQATRIHQGLGLAFCKMMVEAMNGQIEVDDAPGGGALFRIRLLLSDSAGLSAQSGAA